MPIYYVTLNTPSGKRKWKVRAKDASTARRKAKKQSKGMYDLDRDDTYGTVGKPGKPKSRKAGRRRYGF